MQSLPAPYGCYGELSICFNSMADQESSGWIHLLECSELGVPQREEEGERVSEDKENGKP